MVLSMLSAHWLLFASIVGLLVPLKTQDQNIIKAALKCSLTATEDVDVEINAG
jgi:hypothetical protein